MKNLFYLGLILVLGCNPNNGNNGNNVNNVDYFFEIELGGVTHNVQGNTATKHPGFTGTIGNACTSFGFSIVLSISDKTEFDYISGDVIEAYLLVDDVTLGSNTSSLLNLSGSDFYAYLQSIGGSASAQFIENGPQTLATVNSNNINKITNINITDLGTPSSFANYPASLYIDWGETIKGSYQGVLYFANASTLDYDILVPISIEFNAVRYPL